jgi:hypothetical protein
LGGADSYKLSQNFLHFSTNKFYRKLKSLLAIEGTCQHTGGTSTKGVIMSKHKQDLQAEFIRNRYYLDEQGNLRWSHSKLTAGSHFHLAGDLVAGTPTPQGYVMIGTNFGGMSKGRVVWLLHTGDWPRGEIDHIDHNPQNNHPSNLRDLPRVENAMRPRSKGWNKAGLPKGVYIYKCGDRTGYTGYMKIFGIEFRCGVKDTVEEVLAWQASLQ